MSVGIGIISFLSYKLNNIIPMLGMKIMKIFLVPFIDSFEEELKPMF